MTLQLDGETRVFLIVGDPIAQVKSPSGLSAILAARGVNALVIPAHVVPADLAGFLAGVRRMRNLDGIVATVPHKAAALGWCDIATERGAVAGAVNVLRRQPDGRWWGDNTDGQGYLDGIAAEGFKPEGRRALLVGAGGAGSAIAYEILARGAAHLAVHDVDIARRDALLARLAARFPGKAGIGGRDPRGFDLIANATPLGMQAEDPLPIEVEHLGAGQFVAEAVTKPEVTPLLVAARAAGCGTMTGAGMFGAQAELLVDMLLAGGPAR